jgi:hypothetical protein
VSATSGPILTLEPLIEAVRDGIESVGWALSGLQKTTSHQFEGRWEGESTRSAYLFFHRPDGWESVGVDVYLDETSRGLQGSLSLVVEAPPFGEIGDPAEVLGLLGAVAAERFPPGSRTPISLRVRLEEPTSDPAGSEVELRFKLRIPGAAVESGGLAVSDVASSGVRAFESLLAHPGIHDLMILE